MSKASLITFDPNVVVSVKDELEKKFHFVVGVDVLAKFERFVKQRTIALGGEIRSRIPANYVDFLSGFVPTWAPSETTREQIQSAGDEVNKREALAIALYCYLTDNIHQHQQSGIIERHDYEDAATKKVSFIRFKQPIAEGCIGLNATAGKVHRTLVLLDRQLLVWIAGKVGAAANGGSTGDQRLVNLSHRKLKTGTDVTGEWSIFVDVLNTQPPRADGLQFNLTIKSRSALEPAVLSSIVNIPPPLEEEDEVPDDIVFSPWKAIRGVVGSQPLPRYPARIPLPKPVSRGPQIEDLGGLQPNHSSAVLSPDSNESPHYRVDPQNVHIAHEFSGRDGHYSWFAMMIFHLVPKSVPSAAVGGQMVDNNSLKMGPAVYYIAKDGSKKFAKSVKLGVADNSDPRFPRFHYVDGNLNIIEDVMAVVRAEFVSEGSPGRDNQERARAPASVPQPLELCAILEEETSGVRYQLTMQQGNPPLDLPTIDSVKEDAKVSDLSLFIFADDVVHGKRKWVACYVDPEDDDFVIKCANRSCKLDLHNCNYFSYKGLRSGQKEMPIDSFSCDGIEAFALIDHESYPPMMYGIRVKITTETSSADGCCHIRFKKEGWFAETTGEAPVPSGEANPQTAETDASNGAQEQDPVEQLLSRHVSSITEFTVMYDEMLGCGAYGAVYKGFDNDRGQFVAVKECHVPSEVADARKIQKSIHDEYTTLTSLRHPNILRVLKLEAQGQLVRIMMDWMAAGSVASIIKRTRHRLHEAVVRRFACDALKGLAYLHGKDILHLDIKPANLLVDSEGAVKLGDFGTSRLLTGNGAGGAQFGVVGTAAYMAPEMIKVGASAKACDIWSFACSVVEIASGEMPWSHLPEGVRCHNLPLMFHIASAEQPNHHPLIPAHLSGSLKKILESCFAYAPAVRPSAEDLLRNPYFTSTALPEDAESSEEFQRTVVSEANSGTHSDTQSSWDDASYGHSVSSTVTRTVDTTA